MNYKLTDEFIRDTIGTLTYKIASENGIEDGDFTPEMEARAEQIVEDVQTLLEDFIEFNKKP